MLIETVTTEEFKMFEKIQAYLASQLDIPADEITRDTTFESLGVDSLDTVEMVMDLEEQLGVDLELEEKIATVGELVDFSSKANWTESSLSRRGAWQGCTTWGDSGALLPAIRYSGEEFPTEGVCCAV